MTKIAAVIMVKNEEHRISVTIDSAQQLDGIILFDTGSVDKTIEIVRERSRIPVHISESVFVDFAQSRNKTLEFANECARLFDYDFFLLLDANDELIGDRPEIRESEGTAWYVEQRIKYHPNKILTFKNVKFVKAKRDELRYEGVVHEYLNGCGNICHLDSIHIFQDKTLDDDKSKFRWTRDKELLEQAPFSPRNVFYLAQTYECLGESEKALEWYRKRSCMKGFEEETFHSLQKCGEMSEKIGNDFDAVSWYFEAFCHSKRAEPLVALVKMFTEKNRFDLAFHLAELACELEFPKDALLFVERYCYEYERWHLMGIVAYYAAQSGDDTRKLMKGKLACEKAIQTGVNQKLDEKNHSFYLAKIRENSTKLSNE